MRWLTKSEINRGEWHLWFAWYPVTISGSFPPVKVWWEWVWRREEWFCSHGGDTIEWEYRLPKKED